MDLDFKLFDPTTPFGQWDELAKQYENSTDKDIWNFAEMDIAYALHHLGWNASPTPVSGDTLNRMRSEHLAKKAARLAADEARRAEKLQAA